MVDSIAVVNTAQLTEVELVEEKYLNCSKKEANVVLPISAKRNPFDLKIYSEILD